MYSLRFKKLTFKSVPLSSCFSSYWDLWLLIGLDMVEISSEALEETCDITVGVFFSGENTWYSIYSNDSVLIIDIFIVLHLCVMFVCVCLTKNCHFRHPVLMKGSFIFRLLSGQLALGPLISHIPPHLIRHFRPVLDTSTIRHGCGVSSFISSLNRVWQHQCANNENHIQTHFSQMTCDHWEILMVNSTL